MKPLQCVVFHTNLSDNTSPFAIRIKYTLHHGPLNNPERTKSGDTGDPVVIESAFCSYDVSAAFIILKNISYGKRGVPKFTFGNLIPRHYRSLESDIEKIWIWLRRKVFDFNILIHVSYFDVLTRFWVFLQFITEHVPLQGELEYRRLVHAYTCIDKWVFYKRCNRYAHEYSIVLNNAHACNLVCFIT